MASTNPSVEQKVLSGPISVPPQLTTRKLSGTNYIQWSKAVKIALTGYGKQKHLTELAPASTDTGYDKWIQEDAHIVSLLWNSMEPQVADMCTHLDTCKEIWEYVRLLFSSDLTRMYDLSREFFQLQQSGKSVTDYFASLKRVYEELNSIQPLTMDIQEMQKQRKQMVVLRFLAGLDPEFEPVRAQILSGASLPSFAETYSRVMRAASRDSPVHLDPSQSALISHTPPSSVDNSGNRGGRTGGGRGRGGRGKGSRFHCTNCGKPGHTREKCWDLIERPPHMANTASSDAPTVTSATDKRPQTITLSEEEYSRLLQY